MPIGTVKFFNESKGYGFIAPEGGGNDAFVHISAVERAGMSPSLGEYHQLLTEAFARTGKSVRLMGVGVRFAPVAQAEPAQLPLL